MLFTLVWLMFTLAPFPMLCFARHAVATLPYPSAASYVEHSNETRFVVGSSSLPYTVPRALVGVRPAFVYHTPATVAATSPQASDPVEYRGVAPTYSLTDTVNLPSTPVGWRFGPASSNGSAPHQLAPVKETSLDFGALTAKSDARSVSFGLRATANSSGLLFAVADNVVSRAQAGHTFPFLAALSLYLETGMVTGALSSMINATNSTASRADVYLAVHVDGAQSRLVVVSVVDSRLSTVYFDGHGSLFDGQWHLVVLVVDEEGSNNIARLFIDGHTSYNSRDHRKCMPTHMTSPVKSKLVITFTPTSVGDVAYDNGTFIVGHATNVSLYNLQFHGAALTQERIIQTLGVAWMKENLAISQAASITIAIVLLIVGCIVVWDGRNQHSEELGSDPESSTNRRYSTTEGTEGNALHSNSVELPTCVNGERDCVTSADLAERTAEDEQTSQMNTSKKLRAEPGEGRSHEEVRARTVGAAGKGVDGASGVVGTMAALCRDSDSVATAGWSISTGTLIVEKLIAILPTLFDVFQGLNLYFRGWSWPYTFKVVVGFIALPFSFDLALPTLHIPPVVTVVLMLVMGVAGVVIMIYFARRDATLFENALERYDAATTAYEKLMLAVFHSFKRHRGVITLSNSDLEAAAKLVVKLRKPLWTKEDVDILLPQLKDENAALPLLLASAMPPPPANAVHSVLLKFGIEQNVTFEKTEDFAFGLAHSKPDDSIIDIARHHALTALDQERAEKLMTELCQFCELPTPCPFSPRLPESLCQRLLRLTGGSVLPAPNLLDVPSTNFAVRLFPIECIDAEGIDVPLPMQLLAENQQKDLNVEASTWAFQVRDSTRNERVEQLLFLKALADVVINGTAASTQRLGLDAVNCSYRSPADVNTSLSEENSEDVDTLEFTDVRICSACVSTVENEKRQEYRVRRSEFDGSRDENRHVAIGTLRRSASPSPKTARCATVLDVVAGNCMKCPRHNAHVMPAVADRHYRVTAPDGSVAYKCTLSQAHFFKEVNDLGPCSLGDVYVCPDDKCGYAICQLCANKWGPKAKARALLSGKLYAAKRDPTALISLLAFLGLQFVYLPAVQNALMVIACHPIYHCTFPVCYEGPTASFIVAAVASVLLVIVLGLGLPLFWFRALRRRRQRISQVVETDAQWKWLLSLDHSVLSNLYRKYESKYMLFEPLLLISGKASLVAAVAFTEANSVLQMSFVSGLQAANALLLVVTDPLSDPWADITVKAGQAHQLFQLAWICVYRATVVDEPEVETPIVIIMLVSLVVFLGVFSWIIFKSVVRPYLDGRNRELLAKLHRQECAALGLPFSRALKELHVVLEQKEKAFPPLKTSFFGPRVHPHWQVIVTRCLINYTRMKDLGASHTRDTPQWQTVVGEERQLVHDLQNYLLRVYFPERAGDVDGFLHFDDAEHTPTKAHTDVGDFNQTLLSEAPKEYLEALSVALAGKYSHPDDSPPLTSAFHALIRNQHNFAKGSSNAFSLLVHTFTVKGKCIEGKSFAGASLADADIQGATFINCDFANATLTGVNATLATFEHCNFVDAALTAAKLGFSGARIQRWQETASTFTIPTCACDCVRRQTGL